MAKRRGHGEGSVTRRKDGAWQGSILVGHDPETGKPKQRASAISTPLYTPAWSRQNEEGSRRQGWQPAGFLLRELTHGRAEEPGRIELPGIFF